MAFTDIFKPIRKRTITAYRQLFKQPDLLFGRGTQTIIFPNGSREIWIGNLDGTIKFRVTASDGPAGFGVRVAAVVGSIMPECHVLTAKDYETTITEGTREVEMVAYYPDPYAQGFKAWYHHDLAADGTSRVKHPSDLGIKPERYAAEDTSGRRSE